MPYLLPCLGILLKIVGQTSMLENRHDRSGCLSTIAICSETFMYHLPEGECQISKPHAKDRDFFHILFFVIV